VSLASDVQYYLQLQPRQLPSRYFYDALGSALFEAICQLPWYGVTRAESRLLHAYRDEIFERTGRVSTLVELGSGSGDKLRTLALAPARTGRLTAHLVDVSAAALATAARTLADVDNLTVVTHEAGYEDGLERSAREPRGSGATVALFLGSNLGNFDRPGAESLVRSVRAALAPEDWFVLGVDLVKPERDLLLAYDDPLGVTAAFNRNLLVRLNRDLESNFDLNAFAHRAMWNAAESRVEMHLVSMRQQQVHFGRLDLQVDLHAGDAIWTESSYKYEPDDIVRLVERAGFACDAQWVDGPDRFALTLLRAV
jgi:L-histidine Nalpha-methyltransferase